MPVNCYIFEQYTLTITWFSLILRLPVNTVLIQQILQAKKRINITFTFPAALSIYLSLRVQRQKRINKMLKVK